MKKMRIHIIMHEDFESPGAIEAWIQKNHFQSTYTRLYNGDKFPKNIDFDVLIIMGGPQSPSTTLTECDYFDAKKEITFIGKVIQENKIVLGICLGAQLIGEALGASFNHSPQREIGLFPVTLTDKGKKDVIIGQFPEKFLVGHWHGDMPGLTQTSEVLAMSDGCPRQIIRYTPRVYGFQCHFEFTPATIQSMIDNSLDELEKYKHLPYIQTMEQLLCNDYSQSNVLLYTFLDSLIQ